jgi:hypothetical protein
MTFVDVAAGASVFADANTFVYHFQPHPTWGVACNQFMTRIEQGDIVGYTSPQILGDVAHRLVTMEACTLHGWTARKVTSRLRHHRGVIQTLSRFRSAIDRIQQSRIHVVPITGSLMAIAMAISQQFDLLTNDALIVAVMQAHGLTHLASNDRDFDRVPGITRYSPV